MLTVHTLFTFLIGRRDAISVIAADPHALAIGFLFTLSAGLARHYDRSDLRRHPWRPLISTAVSALLTLLLLIAACLNARGPLPGGFHGFVAAYRSLLALVWMTAPLAWLYAIPWERLFPSPRRALKARLWTLAIVSAWRVLLTIRVLDILMGGAPLAAAALVMLFVDSAALLALYLTRSRDVPSTPRIVGLMGGVVTPTRRQRSLLRHVSVRVAVWGALTYPVWLFSAFIFQARGLALAAFASRAADTGPPATLYLLAGGSIVVFACLLPLTQPALRRRSRVESLLASNDPQAAIDLLSAHTPRDFPPAYRPPPTDDFREPPALLSIIELLAARDAAPWVRDAYLRSFREYLRDPSWYLHYEDELERIVRLLQRLPEGRALARVARTALRRHRLGRRRNRPYVLAFDGISATTVNPPARRSGQLRKLVRTIVQLARARAPNLP